MCFVNLNNTCFLQCSANKTLAIETSISACIYKNVRKLPVRHSTPPQAIMIIEEIHEAFISKLAKVKDFLEKVANMHV